MTGAQAGGIHGVVKALPLKMIVAAALVSCGFAQGQQSAPAGVMNSAVAAVSKLGVEVVQGHFQVAVDQMNPIWKDRMAARVGGMEKLKEKLNEVPLQMVAQGISMLSFKPVGQPTSFEVWPGKKVETVNGQQVETLVYTKWLVFVPTETRFRIVRENERPLEIQSNGFQVAITDKDKSEWTFIDGSGLSISDLRSMFINLPMDIQLPKLEKKEVR
ncbi:hypothetical protein JIN85_03715 [Luteolibacter pohnpeiensis]|uniref:Uncharacterized protein n=1 Tax=Luteolibacter pohnpeiensis TaxID=454153 RepID=A0A934S9Y9_9BACT|nr:hypothetical protein [Luteolibacter pohnpeiensis]MBK1881508.1 hypothetical protein [Luteolibacter pohnpeiensis]